MSSEPLQVAYRLIREGNKAEAIRVLTPIVRADPQNADAWWLLANAVDNPEQKRRALERVLRLRPEDERARRAYDTLQRSQSVPRRAAPPPPPLVETRRTTVDDFTLDDDFEIDPNADPFGEAAPVERVRVRKARGRSPCAVILMIVGLVGVLACGLCAVLVFAAPTLLGGVLGDVMGTVTYMPEYPTFEAILTQLPGVPAMMETAAAEGAATLEAAGDNVSGALGALTPPAPQTDAEDAGKANKDDGG